MICLVHMPYAATEHPSIALGLLQAELKAHGLATTSLYPNLRWCEVLGSRAYLCLLSTLCEDLVAEWTFAEAAFGPSSAEGDEAYLAYVCSRGNLAGRAECESMIRQARAGAGEFIESLAQEILALKPRVVGCSSTFQQNCASLALLRRLKQLDPGLYTVMGGANCEGEMGATLVANFSWVDFVVSGEADKLVGPFFADLLAGRVDPPFGVITRDRLADPAPRATFSAMDQTAVPDYDDYFRALQGGRLDLLPGLLIETSRGCWWGQKHHCTFCGLNGQGMGYRSKSAERVLAEMDELSTRYRLGGFEVVDNILDHGHLKTILPVLAHRPQPYRLFYETKSNLKREQVELLARAGVGWIQPGIESLHDKVLQLMDKGSTALTNIQLLQHCREFGVKVIWNFLTCFPGEVDEWYRETAEFIPLLHHLQPAKGVARIRYDRFSPYHSDPQKYGIRLRPSRTYGSVYPLPPSQLEKLAYFFEDHPEDEGREDRRLTTPGRWALAQAVKTWSEVFHSHLPPILSLQEVDDVVHVLDTRRVARRRRHELRGRPRELLLHCRSPRRLEPNDEDLRQLVEDKLVLQIGDRFLSLPVAGALPTLPTNWDFPGGYPERPPERPPYQFPAHLGAEPVPAT